MDKEKKLQNEIVEVLNSLSKEIRKDPKAMKQVRELLEEK